MSDRNQHLFLDASGVVTTKPAQLVGWTARTSSDATIKVFKGTAAGTDDDLLSELDVLEADKSGGVMGLNVQSGNGIYVEITGNARVCVYYKEKSRD